jgi:hypothetical protein
MPDLSPILAAHTGHRIVLAPYGAFGVLTRVVLVCETCDVELADIDVTTGEPTK